MLTDLIKYKLATFCSSIKLVKRTLHPAFTFNKIARTTI